MTLTFLTDGAGHFIGPYHPDEPLARHRGKLTLTENFGAAAVWVIDADTQENARRAWDRLPAAERRPAD